MSTAAVVSLVAVAALVATCGWVHRDATANADAGTPVVLRVGDVRIDTPESWTIGCLLLFVVFLPLYLAARNTSFTGCY